MAVAPRRSSFARSPDNLRVGTAFPSRGLPLLGACIEITAQVHSGVSRRPPRACLLHLAESNRLGSPRSEWRRLNRRPLLRRHRFAGRSHVGLSIIAVHAGESRERPRDRRLEVDRFRQRGVTSGFDSAQPRAVVSRAARRSLTGCVRIGREDVDCKSTIPGGGFGMSGEDVDVRSTTPGVDSIPQRPDSGRS
ncbi:hypothetical protein ThimaDRAFT_4689 [Thiocapsa marina 5811]|uniref:Uncharacterized protein n=1 Tax=Thiocapsa marina 5811 TaxID=768671 RepID=F9UID6_9GAMM|nr:hypothetical protein ThimaDRAFT_4689 [Thiocapsa marina 5811]